MSDQAILSIVSGKGGVGKTTLALALAQELSAAGNRVLLVDLDFTNRGLLELVSHTTTITVTKSEPIKFASSKGLPEDLSLSILHIGPNIQVLDCPALTPDQISHVEAQTIAESSIFVRSLLSTILARHPADIVLLDCHGSRDTVSYAACGLSDHVLVISTDDKITFYGTIRFIREARELFAEMEVGNPKFHLVFNATSGLVRTSTLAYWYNRHFRKYFDDDRFCAAIPLEPRVSIASSEELFPTRRYHYSAMAEKVRLLVWDLFQADKKIRVSAESRFVSKIAGVIIRPIKPLFALLTDVKVPYRALVVISGLIYVSLMLWINVDMAKSVTPKMTLPEMLIGLVALTSSFVLLFTWILALLILKAVLEWDLIISGVSRRLQRRQVYGVISRLGLMYIAGSVLSILPLVLTPNAFVKEPNPELSNQLLASFIDPDTAEKVREIAESMSYATAYVVFFFGCFFIIIFVARWTRTLLFRVRSLESLYRLGTAVLFIGLLVDLYAHH